MRLEIISIASMKVALCQYIRDGDLMIMVMDYIKIFESGRLVIRFYDGTEFECETK